jgi:ribosomal protein S18 acetylase RimI-like enzyme
MPPDIRPANIADMEALADIHVRTWQSAYRGIVPDALLDQLAIEQRTGQWRSWLTEPSPGSAAIVAIVDSTIAAFVLVGRSGDDDAAKSTGELLAIYILPDFQNQGLGTSLMTAGLTSLRDHGFTRATLWVLEKNFHAQAFYERNGWIAEAMMKSEQFGTASLTEVRNRTTL